jgi:hypothetical protein
LQTAQNRKTQQQAGNNEPAALAAATKEQQLGSAGLPCQLRFTETHASGRQ